MCKKLITFLLICIIAPVFAAEHNVEADFKEPSPEDMDRLKPSAIEGEDVKALLRFAGYEFELTKEWDSRLVYKLHSMSQYTGKGMALHQVKNFPMEALVFYSAIGASMARKAYTDSVGEGGRADPRWMENFLYEITSPVGLFSFFCFVMFSGQTNVLYSKWLTTNVGPFKKGPLKGLKISRPFRAWLEPSLVDSRLGHLRHQAIVSGKGAHYFGARLGRGALAGFGGQLGMAVGMLASNIVHEIDTVTSFSPNFKPCMENIKNDITFHSEDNDANSEHHCDLFFDELGYTAQSWLPGLASLISASLISHQLVNGAVGAGKLGARGIGVAANKTISSGFLKGAVIRTRGRVPIANLARGATWLVPVPGVRVAKGAEKLADKLLIPSVFRFLKWFGGSRQSPLFRFINLYAFMETDALITTPFFNYLWTDNMKAGAVSDNISDFMQYLDVDHTTAICENPAELECSKYHDMILTAQKTGLRFDGWRQYKMQMPMMAYQNWFKYVSNALGSIEETYEMYKYFFLAKKGVSPFNETRYLSVEFEDLPEDFFKKMVDIIDEYLEENKNTEENEIDLNVVSLSSSRFIKSETVLKNRNQIILLRTLFDAHRSEVPLEPFYGDDWTKAKEENRKKVLDSSLSNNFVEIYFDILEKRFTLFKESLGSVQEEYAAFSDQERESLLRSYLEAGEEEITIRHYREYLFENFFSDMIDITKSFVSMIREETQEMLDKFNLPEGTHFLFYLEKAYAELERDFQIKSETEPFSAWYFSGWQTLFAAMDVKSDNPSNIASDEAMQTFITLMWDDVVVPIRDEILDKLPIDDDKIENNLRKRVLAAGIEYLKEAVDLKLKAKTRSIDMTHPDYIEEKLGRKQSEIPTKAFQAYLRLLNLKELSSTEDIVFARLYEQMFVDMSDGNSESNYVQVIPRPQGMHVVEAQNNLHQIKKEQFDITYHPPRLGGIRTPYMTDFIVASALCGPDVKIKEGDDLLWKGLSVLSTEDPRSAFESVFAEEDIDDIMDAIPVFDRSFWGKDYSFSPPRIVTMDERERKAICSGLFSGKNRIIEDIYDGRFRVGDKEYSNLLHLVLDHVGLEKVSSVKEFDDWWHLTIKPYMQLFQLAADREYKKVVENGFIEPFFNDDIEWEIMESGRLAHSLNQPLLDQTLVLSRGWFEEIKGFGISVNSHPKQYSFALPTGAFHNMHFELLYWSDLILHFVHKREDSISDEDLRKLKDKLSLFTDAFRPPEDCSAKHSFMEMSVHCQAWAKSFLDDVKKLEETVLASIISLLGIDKNRLMQTAYPEDIRIEDPSQEKMDTVKTLKNKSVGFFFCDYEDPGLIDEQGRIKECEPTSLPQQFLNYSMIRFDKILKEAINYMIHIGNISEHRDVLSVTTSGGG